MATYLDTLEHLKQVFESRLFSFPINKQAHYAERLYRITGDEKYIQPIRLFVKAKAEERLRWMMSIADDQEAIKLYGLDFLEERRGKTSKARLLARLDLYKQVPELKYYMGMVWYLSKFSDYSLEIIQSAEVSAIKEILGDVKFEKYLESDQLLKADPVQTINMVFHLRKLGINDLVDDYIQSIEDVLSEDDSEFAFENRIYFYTHILISESDYYQKFINEPKYDYIYDYFEQHADQIFSVKNNDLIAEVGVCMKLGKKMSATYDKIVTKIEEELAKSEGGYLPRDDQDTSIQELHRVEHRNVLAIILLSDLEELYTGPIVDTEKL